MSRGSGIDGIILDLEGTLYRGDDAIPGAVAAVDRLRAAGLAIRFLTNTTSSSRRMLGTKLRRLGFEAADGEIFTGATAAAEYLRQQGGTAWLLLPEAAHEDFAGVPLDERRPDWIVVGDLGAQWSFELLNRAFVALHERDARLLALVRSRYWRGGSGLQLDAGPFVVALEYAAATQALTFGKPAAAAFLAPVRSMSLPPQRVIMVGDDPETDVAAARDAGLQAALVLSGKVTDAVAARAAVGAAVPVLGSVAELQFGDPPVA